MKPESKKPEVTEVDDEVTHAKKEIDKLVKSYCAAYNTLDPRKVQAVYPQANVELLKGQFRNYNSLKCTVVGDVNYELITVSDFGGDHEIHVARVTAGQVLREGKSFSHLRGNGFHY